MSIALRGITKSFQGVTVIPPLTIEFSSRAFTTLLGPSGCGKTTLLRMIAGLETPDAGEILFDGKPVFSADLGLNLPPEKRNIGFVFQDFALWPHLTVFENVAFPLRARKDLSDLESKVTDALSLVGLADFAGRRVSELSGGQQQRVGFARAIVSRPNIVLFDEPLSALDAQLRETMRSEIKRITSALAMTSIFVTHDQEEAMSMSDRILVLNHGALEQAGSPIDIYTHPATRFAAEFVGQSNFIDDQRMFRPEFAEIIDLKANSSPNHSLIFTARVEQTEYIGGRWLIDVSVGDKHWRLAHSAPQTIGSQIQIAVNPAGIVTVGG